MILPVPPLLSATIVGWLLFLFVYRRRTTICFAGLVLLFVKYSRLSSICTPTLPRASTTLGTAIKRQRYARCAYPCAPPFLTCLGRFNVNVVQDLVGRTVFRKDIFWALFGWLHIQGPTMYLPSVRSCELTYTNIHYYTLTYTNIH